MVQNLPPSGGHPVGLSSKECFTIELQCRGLMDANTREITLVDIDPPEIFVLRFLSSIKDTIRSIVVFINQIFWEDDVYVHFEYNIW